TLGMAMSAVAATAAIIANFFMLAAPRLTLESGPRMPLTGAKRRGRGVVSLEAAIRCPASQRVTFETLNSPTMGHLLPGYRTLFGSSAARSIDGGAQSALRIVHGASAEEIFDAQRRR